MYFPNIGAILKAGGVVMTYVWVGVLNAANPFQLHDGCLVAVLRELSRKLLASLARYNLAAACSSNEGYIQNRGNCSCFVFSFL